MYTQPVSCWHCGLYIYGPYNEPSFVVFAEINWRHKKITPPMQEALNKYLIVIL